MSTRNPARLLRLAGESLLRDQVAVIAALKYMPTQLFPPLFILACLHRKWEPLKAMVQAWPCSVLPLGSLGRLPPVKVLKAVLEGLADLSAQNVHPSRWKLQVLDLRSMDVNLRRRWCAHSTQECSQTELVAVHCSSPNTDHALPHLKVVLDINFSEMGTFKFYMYVIQWAQQQREAVVHLCCKMLKFYEFPLQRARKVLDRVQLDCIQEVQVFCTWDLPTLGAFANYLGQMTNLQSLSLNHIKVLHRLDEMLRCLQTPLDELLIGSCPELRQSDLTHLFQCPNLRQLKSLCLYFAKLADFGPKPL
ncbi:PRAME family member 12-like [Myotis daubentonii]|uniref:PRAME family member 12-like n=1 Tax=Myotis daubentonii TaxID=98922 RepID=UPI002873401D|nr:PRAME family member 12-like [Myotis daubentonii]